MATTTPATFTQDLQKYLTIASTGLRGLETIDEMINGVLIDANTSAEIKQVLGPIAAVVDAIKAGITGQSAPESVDALIQQMRDRFASNDAQADAALKTKYPQS